MNDETILNSALTTQSNYRDYHGTLSTLNRIEANTTALESLVEHFESTDESSAPELAMADVVMELATQDTDVTPEHLVPGLESYIGKQVSTEGIKDTIIKYYQAFVEFVKKFWDQFKTFIKNLNDTVTPLLKEFEGRSRLIETRKNNRLIDPEVLIGPVAKKLAVAYKTPNNYEDLRKPLMALRDVSSVIFRDYAETTSRLAEDIIKVNQQYGRNSSEELIKHVNETVLNNFTKLRSLLPNKVADSQQPTGISDVNLRSDYLFNNKAVFAYIPEASDFTEKRLELSDKDKGNAAAAEIAKAGKLRKMFAILASTEDPSIKLTAKADGMYYMESMNQTQMTDICNMCIETLQTVKRFNDTYLSKLDSLHVSSMRTAKQYADSLSGNGRLSTDGSIAVTDAASLKAILSYHSSIAKWSAEPFGSHLTYVLKTSRELLLVLNKHIGNVAEAS